MRVLSLFDGISCGHIALDRAGIPIEVYYASEIDKYAIQITQKNYPNTIQLGDINNIDFTEFIGKVDLIMGGSPCQDLSIAGKRKGLTGERSGLFYKFVEAIEVIKPKYFLLENNVGMPKEAYEEISRLMGCYPIEINSALVSAQTRKRYYWTNIGPQELNLFGFPTCKIPQPEDKGILLKDILESGIAPDDKSRAIIGSIGRTTDREYFKKNQGQMVTEPICVNSQSGRAMTEKANCLQTQSEFYQYIKPCALRNRGEGKQPEFNGNDKANALTSVNTDCMVCEPVRIGYYGKGRQGQRIYSVRDKSVSLSANGGGRGAKTGLYKTDLPDGEYLIRKLTPIECERLQTLPDRYTEFGLNNENINILAKKSETKSKKELDLKERYVKISDTQRYKCIGNSWTVDVIAHIFSFLPKEAILKEF